MGRTSGSSGLDDAGRTFNSGLLDGQLPASSTFFAIEFTAKSVQLTMSI
jgi:hypothetical protein